MCSKKTGKEVALTAADILGNPECLAFSSFQIGFQTGSFAPGTQTINQVAFNAKSDYTITTEWTSYSIPLAELDQGAD